MIRTHTLITTALLLLASALHAAQDDTSVLVVVGAAGHADYAKEFNRQADAIKTASDQNGVRTTLIGLQTDAPEQDREKLRQAITSELQQTSGALWIFLIGHGTYYGRAAKFNLRGPDITTEELADWLKPAKRPILLINTASASAPFVKALTGPDRVVITATKSGDEKNITRFGGFFVDALTHESSDLDRDGQTSCLEAFLAATRHVNRFYEEGNRLATEHALIDDNGDGLGSRGDWFRGVRPTRSASEQTTPDGYRAHQFHLLPHALERQLTDDQKKERDRLERAVTSLRNRRSELSEKDYFAELESVLIQLARLYQMADTASTAPTTP